jgi:hypothetical protein
MLQSFNEQDSSHRTWYCDVCHVAYKTAPPAPVIRVLLEG